MSSDEYSATGAAKIGPSLKDFTNIFVLSPTSNSEQVLFEVPKALVVDPFRQRRAHQKSRTGCENCRRRRVKCNDETPCASCSRRGERCQRVVRGNGVTSIPSSPAQTLLPGSESTGAVVNLLHLKLFHHFQTWTLQTLLFAPEVWGHALQLSFQFEFLTNAILCVAARHLAVLQPEDATYPAAASSHLCRALSLFRHELFNNFNSTNLDAFVATSFLLQYEMWISTDFFSPQDDGLVSFDPSRDRIFAFSSSLKEVFLKNVPLILHQPSVFMRYIQHNPGDILVGAAQISNGTLAKYHDYFSYHRPLSLKLLSIPLPYTRSTDLAISNPCHHVPKTPDAPDPIEDGYAPVVTQLCLILSFLPETRPPEAVSADSPLLPDLARFIFSFPVLCRGPFVSMVQQSDPHALLLLYHFYRAVRILLPPDQCWWAHKRATVSETLLKEWLARESAKQADA
ncbi:hypothetical protein V1525DRAFT_388921 [Lipomyces kononenkoae]|uniref:Uncharacterized protein n=1 Tax=Lipomyces kononenkoae TaxID=34357 RepID=A0ACC3T0A5_LIPKO